MKVVINAEYATSMLNLLTSKVVKGQRTIIPILSCILLETLGSDTLVASATNLSTSATVELSCDVENGGEVVASASLLHGVLKGMTGSVVLSTSGNNLIVTDQTRAKVKLSLADADSYPKIVHAPTPKEVDCDSLFNGIEWVMKSVAKDITRPTLNGVYADMDSETVSLCATDGFRLATTINGKFEGVIIPNELLTIISSLRTHDDVVKMGVSKDSLVTFYIGDYTISSQMVSGEYPVYNPILPQKTYNKISVNPQDIISLLGIASLVNPAQVCLSIEDGNVFITSTSIEGETKLPVSCEKVNFADVAVMVSPSYLKDTMVSCKKMGDKATIDINTSTTPLTITCDGYPGLFVLMPMLSR